MALRSKKQISETQKSALRICLVYLVISALWIISTDYLNTLYRSQNFNEFLINSLKGIFFIIITAFLLYIYLRKYFNELNKKNCELTERENELNKIQGELQIKSNYLNNIIDLSPVAIYDLDKKGNVLSVWNKAAERMYGWKAGEVIGGKLPIISNDKKEDFIKLIELLNSGKSIDGAEFTRIRKDGSDIQIKVHAKPFFNKDGTVESILAYAEDLSLEKTLTASQTKHAEYLQVLYEASLAANRTLVTAELYKVCFGYIEKILDVSGIMIALLTEDGKNIKYDAVWADGESIDPANIPLMPLNKNGTGPLTQAILTGRPAIIDDLEQRVKDSNNKLFVDTDGNIKQLDGEIENISRSAIMIPLVYAGKVTGALQVQNENEGVFTSEDLLKLEPFAFIFASAIQRAKLYKKLQAELAEKAAAFDQVRKFTKGIEQSPNSIVITNSDYEIEYVNPYFTELTGYSPEEVLGKNPNILKSGHTSKEVYRDMWNTLQKGDIWHGEFMNRKKNGELYWESASIGPIFDHTDKITHFIAIKQDITSKKKQDKELKDSLEEKEIMLKEIHHRVKNNLQVISSLLNMQVNQYEHPEALDAINSSRNRVKAMALVHESLYQSRNIGKTPLKEYILMLAKNIYSSYGVSFDKVGLVIETFGSEFGLDTIIPLGLIINEAISNSLKHAFPGDKKGEIYISLSPVYADESNNSPDSFRLIIKDNGKGLPDSFDLNSKNSLGMTLLTSLASQLDGSAEIINNAGTEIIINFKELSYKKRM